MPTIRITEATWDRMNRIAKEMSELGYPEFKDILKITPDAVINELMQEWDDLIIKPDKTPEKEASKDADNKKTIEKMRKIQEKMYREEPEEDQQ